MLASARSFWFGRVGMRALALSRTVHMAGTAAILGWLVRVGLPRPGGSPGRRLDEHRRRGSERHTPRGGRVGDRGNGKPAGPTDGLLHTEKTRGFISHVQFRESPLAL